MLIKGKPTSEDDNQLQSGDFVCYEQDGVLILALVEGLKKGKLALVDMRGREIELSSNRLHKVPLTQKIQLDSKASRVDWLIKYDRSSKERAAKINLEEIWLLLKNESKELTNSGLCELYFGANTTDNHLALRYALVHDKIYFKRRQDIFSPRSDEIVQDLLKAERLRKKKLENYESFVECFKLRLNKKDCDVPADAQEMVCLLEDIAADAPHLDNSRKREGKELLLKLLERLGLELSGSIPEKAYTLLSRVGHFTASTNLVFFRYRIPTAFSAEALEEAQVLSPGKKLEASIWGAEIPRLDLTSLEALSIDDQSTQDMDDALSLEKTAQSFRLGIHISDVSSAIDPASALDHEARMRATSVYCPECTVNMFPDLVAQEKLSLLPQQVRPCLSLICEFDRQLNLLKSELKHTLVRVQRRLDYNSVDSALEKGSDQLLQDLHELASQLESKRFEQGGFRVNKGDTSIVVRENGEFEVHELDESTPARALIGEMMILANSEMSNFAVKNKFALLFRGQEHPETNLDLAPLQVPSGPAEDYFLRSQLKKSFVTTRPAAHATLGLKAYAQITSPIRRYLDLCNQRQISQFLLTGKAYYSSSQLQEIVEQVDHALRNALTLTREAKRFWLLKHLQKLAKAKAEINATIIRVDRQSPLVEISNIYLNALIKGSRKFSLGEKIKIKVSAIDPRYGFLRLEEA